MAEFNPVLIRIAKALAQSQDRNDWQSFVGPAQAILRELREPSDDMLEAASPGLPDWGDLPEGWRAMIDYVLGETQAPHNDNHTDVTVTKAAS